MGIAVELTLALIFSGPGSPPRALYHKWKD
jgi:hypothetical protein